jgi:toxin ParE1/3/4
MARVLRRPKAAEDIAAVWDFIADDNPDAADYWVDQLDTQLRLLATQPLMGRARDELAPGIRSFPFGRHLVFYLPIGDGIDVVRVLHGTRDVDTVFGKDNP